MSAREVNIPLLRKAVEWAEVEAAKPWELSEWHQALWVVEPARVIADRADVERFGVEEGAQKSPECGTCYCIAGYICEVQGLATKHSWDALAADELNVPWRDAMELFDADNSIEDIRRIAESIAGERL